ATASALASALAIERAALWMRGIAGAVWLAVIGTAVIAAIAAALLGSRGLALSILAMAPVGTLVLARARGVQTIDTSWANLIIDHPARLIVATFLPLCALGAVLLSLPACSAGPPIARIDAAFTAVSAVCVTGLIVLDTPNAFSGLGQAVILALLQLGGLGIMTLSTAALGALGRRLSVRHEEAVAGLFSGEHRGLLFVALRRTLAVTVVAELAGAIVLTIAFWIHGDNFGTGLWRGVFTSVSAFCNAGFALQPNNLMDYQSSPAVLHAVAILIVAGGLSPLVIAALPRLLDRRSLPLQVKVVLASTIALLIIGTVGFGAFEWNHSLAELSFADRLQNAWFQSVTLRTAGFNSVDFESLRAATLPLACALMFVGGAPGSTAGGIKVTTMWIFFAAVAGALRGQAVASSFGRRIPHAVVYRAIAIMTISGVLVATVLMGLFLTQDMSGMLAVFEVFSAIGTVGLSMGGTAELDGLGKVMIMIAMFLGRVGPLTVLLFLVERRGQAPIEQLEENLEVG
ncbi:MAG TPA: potassium transporter TrkG, partial [Kofleriaceae bacterium]|nr:potassium transporter TrkG [Kofleriaceae bacterium]